MSSWIVLLEASSDVDRVPIDRSRLRGLLAEMGQAVGLLSSDRCAVQLELIATNQAEALYSALCRWDQALTRLDLPRWRLVRTEVLVPDELEAEFDDEKLGAAMACLRVGDGTDESIGDESLAKELLDRAFNDPLTGLGGPYAFRSRVREALAGSRQLAVHAVVCLRLDGCGILAGGFVRGTGDHVLVDIARRIASALRPTDTLARLGGADFAVLVEGTTLEGVASVTERLLDVVRRPLVVKGREVHLTASAGVTILRQGDAPDDVLRRAGLALSAVKASGGNGYRLSAVDPLDPQESQRRPLEFGTDWDV
jgi:diguanylate cyclase (GGDEF)-like protein